MDCTLKSEATTEHAYTPAMHQALSESRTQPDTVTYMTSSKRDDDRDDDDRDDDDRDDDDRDDDHDNYATDPEYHRYSEEKHDRYVIEVNDQGDVVGFSETKRDGRIRDKFKADRDYRFENGQLIETEIEDDGWTEVKVYEDLDGDGRYTKVSERYIPPEGSNSKFGVTDDLILEGSIGDDLIAMADDTPMTGGAGADSFVMREIGDGIAADFNADEDQLIIDTGLGLSSTEQLANFVTGVNYDEASQILSVDFGGVATLTVVGIAADQISWDIVTVLS